MFKAPITVPLALYRPSFNPSFRPKLGQDFAATVTEEFFRGKFYTFTASMAAAASGVYIAATEEAGWKLAGYGLISLGAAGMLGQITDDLAATLGVAGVVATVGVLDFFFGKRKAKKREKLEEEVRARTIPPRPMFRG